MSECPDCVDLPDGGYTCCCCGLDFPADEGYMHCDHCSHYVPGDSCCHCDAVGPVGPSLDEDE